jgi:hypothetical protein
MAEGKTGAGALPAAHFELDAAIPALGLGALGSAVYPKTTPW